MLASPPENPSRSWLAYVLTAARFTDTGSIKGREIRRRYWGTYHLCLCLKGKLRPSFCGLLGSGFALRFSVYPIVLRPASILVGEIDLTRKARWDTRRWDWITYSLLLEKPSSQITNHALTLLIKLLLQLIRGSLRHHQCGSSMFLDTLAEKSRSKKFTYHEGCPSQGCHTGGGFLLFGFLCLHGNC